MGSLRAIWPRRTVGLRVVLLTVAVTVGGGLALVFGLPRSDAQDYSAYSDPKKPVISVVLSEPQNVEEFKKHFNLGDGQLEKVLAAVRRENEALAQEFGESERVIAAHKGLSNEKMAGKIAASDYDERVSAAVARTKRSVVEILPDTRSTELKSWVDEQWEQEVQTAATEDSGQTFGTASSGSVLRCKVFATQYYGNTRFEVALPHRRLKFGRQPKVRIRRVGRHLVAHPRVKEVGPWNTYDNYWAHNYNRTMWKSLARCKPEAQAAYYWNFHGGRDEFGRKVLNPAGVDLTPAVARNMGLRKYQNAWVYVRFPWTHR